MIEEQANSPTPLIMEKEDDWIIDVLDGLKETTPISPDWSIGKVRRNLRSVNEDAYTPHIASIGPIHYGDESLLPMEDHKRRYLLSLFKRMKLEPEQRLKDCCHTIKGLDEKVRARYAEPIPYDESKLAKILLHDAGFLLELFFRSYELFFRSYHSDEKEYSSILQNDPIFRTSWMVLELQRDLVLLENQIPFFVLESLFKHIEPHAAAGLPPLKELALYFFEFNLNIREKEFRAECWEEGNHLLHLLYNCSLPPEPDLTNEVKRSLDQEADSISEESINKYCETSLDQAGVEFQTIPEKNLIDVEGTEIREKKFLSKCREKGNHLLQLLYNCYRPPKPGKDMRKSIHCATLLYQAGVEFEKNPTPNDFDFQFDNINGTFKIPQLLIEDSTDSLFRNLVAFEQSLPDNKNYITSYIILMDSLIDKTNDVDLLQQKRIIVNNLGGEGDVSNLFNVVF